MMNEFLGANRRELIERCRAKVALRPRRGGDNKELEFGISYFLDQLIETLKADKVKDTERSREISGQSGGPPSPPTDMAEGATKHGRELAKYGFTVEQVVHDYGDLCQSITELALERKAPFETKDFHTLNRCLDDAIADAVTEFSYQRDFVTEDQHADALNLRLGAFAHELRNLLNSATLAVTAIQEGSVGIGGSTGAVLTRSLLGMGKLIDRSLSEVRIKAGMPAQHRVFSVSDLIDDVKLAAGLEAQVGGIPFAASHVDSSLAVDADRDLLSAAVGNLIQNAFKFTEPHSAVNLSAYAIGDRVLIEVEDHCGGLLPSEAETMFLPFTQSGVNKTGLGLGLSISRRSVELNKGTLKVRDVPGSGCVFTIDLPRHALAAPAEAGSSSG